MLSTNKLSDKKRVEEGKYLKWWEKHKDLHKVKTPLTGLPREVFYKAINESMGI